MIWWDREQVREKATVNMHINERTLVFRLIWQNRPSKKYHTCFLCLSLDERNHSHPIYLPKSSWWSSRTTSGHCHSRSQRRPSHDPCLAAVSDNWWYSRHPFCRTWTAWNQHRVQWIKARCWPTIQPWLFHRLLEWLRIECCPDWSD